MRRSITSVPAKDFADGSLPRVCSVSGEPATHAIESTARSRGPLPWLLLLIPVFGWIVVLVVALTSSSAVLKGWIPLSSSVYRRLESRRRLGLWLAIGGVVVAISSIAALEPLLLGGPVGVTALSTSIVGIALLFDTKLRLPRANLKRDMTRVELRGVHDGFSRAAHRHYADVHASLGSHATHH